MLKIKPKYYAFSIVLFIIAILFFACTTTRSITKNNSDTTHTNKVDSGAVKKEVNQNKSENEWWREYLLLQKPVVNEKTTEKLLQPIYNNQPILIREGGKSSNENYNLRYDSGWKKENDSLKSMITTLVKNTKTEVLSFWQIVGLSVCCSLLVAVVIFFLFKFRIL